MAPSRALAGFFAGALALALVVTGAAQADDTLLSSESTTLSMPGRTIQLEPSRSASGVATDTVLFSISGPSPQAIRVEIMDLVVDASGAKSILPAGSTPHTLEGVISTGPYVDNYVPDGTTQSFSVDLTAKGARTDVRFGGIRVSIIPESQADSGSAVDGVSGVLLVVLVVPEGFDGGLATIGATVLHPSPLLVTPLFSENIFEMVFPDIPGVINRGPVAIDVALQNQSINPVFVTTEWVVTSGAETLFSSSSGRALVFAGQVAEESVGLVETVPGSTRTVDVLSGFEFVEIRMSSEASLGQNILDSTEASMSFLVLRWKEPLGILICLGIVGVLLWRSRKTESRQDQISP